MGEGFEAARDRIVATAAMARDDLLGFEYDLEHGLAQSKALASWKIARTEDPRRRFLIHAVAATGDPERIERELWSAYERHIRYEGDDRRATSCEQGTVVLRFATRASGDPSLAVAGEIRVELP